jgi:hypothetical protein
MTVGLVLIAGFEAAFFWSRSDPTKVAVGFNPRIKSPNPYSSRSDD